MKKKSHTGSIFLEGYFIFVRSVLINEHFEILGHNITFKLRVTAEPVIFSAEKSIILG